MSRMTTRSGWRRDNDDALFEFDRTTGVQRRKVAQSAFINAPRFGVGGAAGQARTEDLEALAYDANADVIYAFSGSTSATPTAFRLTRDANHQFQVESWQPLPSEWTGAGWRLADGRTYVASGSTIRTYDFATNTFGPSFSISGLSKIFGIDFDDVTGDLLAVNNKQRLYRASMTTRTILAGWNGISLTGFGLLDTRAVEVIGEQVLVTDGADSAALAGDRPHVPRRLRVRRHRTRRVGPDRELHRDAHHRHRAPHRQLHRHQHRHADELGLDLRRRWHVDGAIALPHLHQHRDLHRDLDRHQRAGVHVDHTHHHREPAVGPDGRLHRDTDAPAPRPSP